MEQYKRAQVMMLPTEQRSHIILDTRVNELQYHTLDKNNDDYQDKTIKTFHHLYIISDDEIKEGDWFIYNNIVYQASNFNTNKNSIWSNEFPKGIYSIIQSKCKKIIATTDTSLTASYGYDGEIYGKMKSGLPQPSQQFITKYIESYNKGEVITNVLVEYSKTWEVTQRGLPGFPEDDISWWVDRPVVNSDNTVNIKSAKESWNKDEVKDLVTKAFKAGYERSHSGYPNTDNHTKPNIDKFIEQNL